MAGRALVTGASGFIGARVAARLVESGWSVRAMLRAPRVLEGCEVAIADLGDVGALERACAGVDVVVHCAGRAHAHGMRDDAQQQAVNHLGSARLAQAAGACGVRHLVFLSSVKAMGLPGEHCVDEDWPAPPETAYGRAKRDAEEAIAAAGARYHMAHTHLRLAMVYGCGGRGNFERMVLAVRRGWFPPLPDTGNRRSLVHVSDVVTAVCAALNDERAKGRTFIVAHPDTPSGAQLFQAMCRSLGKPAPRRTVPEWMLRGLGRWGDALGALTRRPWPVRSEVISRLLDSECYSPDRIMRELDWRACTDLDAGLAEVVAGLQAAIVANRPR